MQWLDGISEDRKMDIDQIKPSLLDYIQSNYESLSQEEDKELVYWQTGEGRSYLRFCER